MQEALDAVAKLISERREAEREERERAELKKKIRTRFKPTSCKASR
mgnify:CR=1 FL=1